MKKITKTVKSYTLDWYSEEELLKLFPNARDIIPKKISEYEHLKTKKEEEISNLIKNINNATSDEFSRWFAKKIISMEHIATLIEYNRHLMRLKRQLNFIYPRKEYTNNFQTQIDYAKSRPIEEIIGRFVEIKKVGNDWICVCPFHADKNPSMRIYSKGQNFYCFGCTEHGSVIDFIIKTQGCSFGEAVKYLQN